MVWPWAAAGAAETASSARAAIGIDGAEARVLPHPVDRPRVVVTEREQVALLHHHVAPILRGQPPRLRHRRIREIERGDLIAMPSQQAGVMATPRARNRNARPQTNVR